MKTLNTAEMTALFDLAKTIGVSPAIVYKLAFFESSLNPLAQNDKSTARGIFQWIDSTARGLGFRSSASLIAENPTLYSQLILAKRYFARMAPFSSDYDFVISNFLPAYRKLSPDTPLLSLPNGEKIQKANPALKTLRDYYNRVKKIKLPAGMPEPVTRPGVLGLVVVGAVLFFSLESVIALNSCTVTIDKNDRTIISPFWLKTEPLTGVQNDSTADRTD